jgi:hypothetical protein
LIFVCGKVGGNLISIVEFTLKPLTPEELEGMLPALDVDVAVAVAVDIAVVGVVAVDEVG